MQADLTLGLRHAQLLRAAVRQHTDPPGFAAAWDAVTEAELAPWYRETVMEDRAPVREMEALRAGLQPPPPDPTLAALLSAIGTDADLFRAFLATRAGLTTLGETLNRPGLLERAQQRAQDPLPFPGPDRSQVLNLLQ